MVEREKVITMLKETTVFYVVPSEDAYVFFGEEDEEPQFEDRTYPDYQEIAFDVACQNNWGIPMNNNYIELYDGEKVTLEPGEHLLKMDSEGNVKIIK